MSASAKSLMIKQVRAELAAIFACANLPPDAKVLTVGYGVTRDA